MFGNPFAINGIFSLIKCSTLQLLQPLIIAKNRYILSAKFTDATGGAWITAFGDDAEKIIGCSADELYHMRGHGDGSSYQTQLKKTTWAPHLFCLMVTTQQYNNEKKTNNYRQSCYYS
ncbi:replication protein A 70 kDa DNA-binding subunit B-like [Bidens hawaiensis]|uniref:replication protein A 70 kDa DNA-binding subunit B-like n=1 Tax=Bidens hawaiensis TaxID=980011 RepID=UPI00404B42F9